MKKFIQEKIYIILAISLVALSSIGTIIIVNYNNQHLDKTIIINGIPLAILFIGGLVLCYLQERKNQRPKYTKTIKRERGQTTHVVEEI